MAIIESLRHTVKDGKLMLHSATLSGDRTLHSDNCWCETKDSSLPYIISDLAEIVVYYDETKMPRDEAVKVLLERVEKDLKGKRENLRNHVAATEANLRLVREKLAEIKGDTV